MEKNDFLLYNEIIYLIHACRTLEELRPTLLTQLGLIIPYSYASLIAVETDPATGELVHRAPYCRPASFREGEQAWLDEIEKSYTAWLSHAPECMVVRDSDILSGDRRFSTPSYRVTYARFRIHDCMQVNITYAGQPRARVALYRTEEKGAFTDREAFYLQSLANHIGLACWICHQNRDLPSQGDRLLEALSRRFELTRREGEVLALVLQEKGNEEIVDRLCITRNTLLKHLQNLYRKCGVSSRWDLMKLPERTET